MIDPKWNLSNLPPIGHEDVAEFAYQLFEIARIEKERLGKPRDFYNNYALYRGDSDKIISGRKGYSQKTGGLTHVNLYFANIERTVSNITARNPVGEVVDMDGIHDQVEMIMSLQLKKWWKDTEQQLKTRSTARMMEIYGITVEKPVRDPNMNRPDIMVTDPFSFYPAPGNWDNIAEEAPYIGYLYLGYVSRIEAEFNVTDVAADEAYELLGQSREELKSQANNTTQTIGNYADPMTFRHMSNGPVLDKKIERGLIIEIWVRDNGTDTTTHDEPMIDSLGEPVLGEDGFPQINTISNTIQRGPDGIRKITITKSKNPAKGEYIVLDDSPNPNINYRHLDYGYDVSGTYPWGRLPVYVANSYRDGMSIWGFAAAEQVGDLIKKINLIISKLIAYVLNVMAPPLIVQQHCGITREMIEGSISKAGRLILMPSTPNARIEYMQIPNLPATFFQVLDLIVKFFDRVYQIEDADRGVGPTGVIAASAIIALQERNQVLMQTKTSAIDYLAEQRSKWAIGLYQNWGIESEVAELAGENIQYRMVDFVDRRFNYAVESGSTTPRTSLQLQEMAKWLFEAKAIGQKGLLQALSWPGYKEEIERTAESQLDQALTILIDSGLPEQYAISLKQFLSQTQFQGEAPKTAAQGHQPVQPKSLIPPSSSAQSGA